MFLLKSLNLRRKPIFKKDFKESEKSKITIEKKGIPSLLHAPFGCTKMRITTVLAISTVVLTTTAQTKPIQSNDAPPETQCKYVRRV